jgi:hypothetical protein
MFACVNNLMMVVLMAIHCPFGDENVSENLCKLEGSGRGGGKEFGMFIFLQFFFIVDIHNCCCKIGGERRGGRRRMPFGVRRWEFCSWIIILLSCCLIFFYYFFFLTVAKMA